MASASTPFFDAKADPSSPSPAPPPGYDPEAGCVADYAAAFAAQSVRDAFARRVLTIVAIQLAVTAAATVGLMSSPRAMLYVASSPLIVFSSWAAAFAITVALACSPTLRTRHPHNMVALTAFTVCYGFLVAVTTSFYSASAITVALVVTAATVAVTAAIVTLRGIDAARGRGLLFIASWAFVAAVAVSAFVRSSALTLAIAGGGAALFAAYLLHDLALIMGGTSWLTPNAAARTGVALDPDDAVMAAITLYMDIATLFLQIVQLVQAAQDS